MSRVRTLGSLSRHRSAPLRRVWVQVGNRAGERGRVRSLVFQ